jgi:DNA-binding NtrC family response regulator
VTPEAVRIVVCDDEAAARRGIVRALSAHGFDFVECADGRECLEILAGERPDLVLLDLRMPGMDGRATLDEIVAMSDPPPVIILTADTSIQTAIEAVAAGAADFVTKPYELGELRLVVQRTLDAAALRRDKQRLEDELSSLRGAEAAVPFIGESAAVEELLAAVDKVAPTAASVLITGETGTGKGLIARRIHQQSSVAEGPFVTLNCTAVAETLVESELFGHRRGAFTGADSDRPGRIRSADGGTLFLDEIGDLPLAAQARLLRVLQEGVVEPVGGGELTIDVRVLAATHRDLKELVAEGSFREDLLFRLRVVEIVTPPLRDRGQDILLLARSFLDEVSPRPLRLTPDAEDALLAHDWPGNVRELRNALERAAIFCRGGIVQAADLPGDVGGAVESGSPAPLELIDWREGDDFRTAKERLIERFERTVISDALARHGGNVSAAARELGMHRQNLQQKIRKLGIDSTDS